MKKTAYTVIALLVLVGSMAVAAQAQSSGRGRLIANIPFQFNVGEKTMPAGEYVITEIDSKTDHALLQLRSKDGRNQTLIQMSNVSGKTSERARMVFNCYGSERYFAQVWTSGDSNGWQAPKSKMERTRQQELAGWKATSETVALR